MAENSDPPEGQNDPPKDDSGKDSEGKFWEGLESRMGALLDKKLDEKLKALKPADRQGQQRNKGRTTLPAIVADLMGGPFARD